SSAADRGLFRGRTASVGADAVELLETPIELLQQSLVAGIPVLDVTALTGLVEILGGVPQLPGVPLLHDLEDLEADVSQRLDLGIPEHRIGLELGQDLRRRQFLRVG